MKQLLYIDTSVLGGCFDVEFSEFSLKLFEEFKTGNKIVALSDLTLRELENAPLKVQKVLDEVPERNKEFFTLNEEAINLASNYIKEKVVSSRFLLDAQHIAIATVNRADVLISWNFKHIVNLRRINLYNATNLKFGYPTIEIRSPREVINDE